jgi:hypothetical protein
MLQVECSTAVVGSIIGKYTDFRIYAIPHLATLASKPISPFNTHIRYHVVSHNDSSLSFLSLIQSRSPSHQDITSSTFHLTRLGDLIGII